MDTKNKDQFIEYFSKGIKSSDQLKIGVEHERFLFEGKEKKRITDNVLNQFFEKLKKNGWEPLKEKKNIIGMMPHPERMIDQIIPNNDGVNLFASLLN